MYRTMIVTIAACALCAAPAAAQHTGHVDKAARSIKALSDAEVAELLAGEGAGQALAAELNRYPGPRHVLELRSALSLTEAQESGVEAIFRVMNERARELGRLLVEREQELDAAFAQRTITADRLRLLTAAIGQLRAELRYAHLVAHLETTALLSHDQIRRYQEQRGYGGGEHAHE